MPTRIVLAVLFPFAKLQYNFGGGASKHTHTTTTSFLLYPLSIVAALNNPQPAFFSTHSIYQNLDIIFHKGSGDLTLTNSHSIAHSPVICPTLCFNSHSSLLLSTFFSLLFIQAGLNELLSFLFSGSKKQT